MCARAKNKGLVWTAVLIQCAGAVWAQSPGADAINAAKIAAVCANCHGDNGISPYPHIPNLAGQNPRYLLTQMNHFASGQRRNEFMEGMIRALKPRERESLARFYAEQTVPPRSPASPALLAQGKDYYEKVCFRCHGADGRGTEDYARLAGQQTGYVQRTLTRYRDPANMVRKNPLMIEATAQLTDAQIQALAAYVASMP
ncbi:c-type cytochrome [Ottowia sp.]|uniref:c-type cytochrome n=1 Tax=Ottowia sp. TaxID=1898956 RepID=UPI003A88BEC7